MREKQQLTSMAVDTIGRSLDTLESQQAAQLAARKQRLEEKLAEVTIDPAAVQARAINSAIDNWEAVLSKGAQPDPPTASRPGEAAPSGKHKAE